VNITGGMDMTLLEVDEAANAIAGEVDADANIIFGAAFDPALDGKIRVSVVATGMEDLAAAKGAPSTATPAFDSRRPAAPYAASRAEPVRHEPVREPARAEAPRQAEPAPVVPTFQSAQPTFGTAARAPEPRPEPVIHVAEDRTLEPIVDPWVEEYESSPRARTAAETTAPVAQGDLYMDRSADRAPQPETRREEPAYDEYDDRDHRKSGWSLFGRGKRQPVQPTYPQSRQTESRMTEMRPTTQAQPAPEPDLNQAEDDLEIPSFLRRLAN
jgi:cell division protein FtsZ